MWLSIVYFFCMFKIRVYIVRTHVYHLCACVHVDFCVIFLTLILCAAFFFYLENQWKNICEAWVELKTQMQKFSYGFFAFLSHFFNILLDDCWFFFFLCRCVDAVSSAVSVWFLVSFYFVACVCVALAYSLVAGVTFFGINRFTFGFGLKLHSFVS